jgi:DNA-binding response OmpR family regulator
MPGKILVIDDHSHIRDILATFLLAAGYEFILCADGTTALARLGSESFDLIISDQRLPDLPGLEVIRKAKEIWPHTPTAVMSGSGELIEPQELRRCGVDYVLAKPFRRHQFMTVVASALSQPV